MKSFIFFVVALMLLAFVDNSIAYSPIQVRLVNAQTSVQSPLTLSIDGVTISNSTVSSIGISDYSLYPPSNGNPETITVFDSQTGTIVASISDAYSITGLWSAMVFDDTTYTFLQMLSESAAPGYVGKDYVCLRLINLWQGDLSYMANGILSQDSPKYHDSYAGVGGNTEYYFFPLNSTQDQEAMDFDPAKIIDATIPEKSHSPTGIMEIQVVDPTGAIWWTGNFRLTIGMIYEFFVVPGLTSQTPSVLVEAGSGPYY